MAGVSRSEGAKRVLLRKVTATNRTLTRRANTEDANMSLCLFDDEKKLIVATLRRVEQRDPQSYPKPFAFWQQRVAVGLSLKLFQSGVESVVPRFRAQWRLLS